MSTSYKLLITTLLLLPNALFGQLKSYSATFEMTISHSNTKLYDDPLMDYQPIKSTVISTYTSNMRKVHNMNSEYNFYTIKDIQKNLEIDYYYNELMKTVRYACTQERNDSDAQELTPYYDQEYDYEQYEYIEPEIDTTIIGSPDSKKILGFNCKRTILNISNGETCIIWTTDEITNYDNNSFGNYISGFIMEFTSLSDNEEIVYKATKIESVTNDAISLDLSPGCILQAQSSSLFHGEFDYSYDTDCGELVQTYGLAKSVKKLNSEIEKLKKKWNSSDFDYFFAKISLDENGNVVDCFIYSEQKALAEELTLLLSAENTWTPAKVNGKSVPCSFELRF